MMWFHEAEWAYNVLSEGNRNHVDMIGYKWQEFQDDTLNASLDEMHQAFHNEWTEAAIGRATGKFLVQLLGRGMSLSNDVKCAPFVEAWLHKAWEEDGYTRFLAAHAKYLARQISTLFSRCVIVWNEAQVGQASLSRGWEKTVDD